MQNTEISLNRYAKSGMKIEKRRMWYLRLADCRSSALYYFLSPSPCHIWVYVKRCKCKDRSKRICVRRRSQEGSGPNVVRHTLQITMQCNTNIRHGKKGVAWARRFFGTPTWKCIQDCVYLIFTILKLLSNSKSVMFSGSCTCLVFRTAAL
jgi:hypothetical protein